MTSSQSSYWAGRRRRRGRHAEDQLNPLRVIDLLEQAVREGRPLRLVWPDTDPAGLAPSEADAPTAVLPVIPTEDETAPGLAELETEPTTATRQARRLLNPGGAAWSPQALAG